MDEGFFARLDESKYHLEDRDNQQPYALFADNGYTDKNYYIESSNDSAFLKQSHQTFSGTNDFTLLKPFHDSLLNGYKNYLSGDTSVLFKMKELWFYMREMFPEDEKLYKKVKKAKNLLEEIEKLLPWSDELPEICRLAQKYKKHLEK